MKYRLLLSFIILLAIKNVAAQSTPSVVVSIKPIHSIVMSLMSGIAEPQLLLKSNNSAHTFHLKPSQVQMLTDADLVIIISEDFESGLRKTIKNIENDSLFQIISLNNLSIHKSRSEILKSKEHEDTDKHEDNIYDLHLWLDINNMKLIAKHINKLLIKIDPVNEDKYNNNFLELTLDLEELKIDLEKQMTPFITFQFAVFSDTTQYFEKSMNLLRPTIITPYHGARLSIIRTLMAKEAMSDLSVSCLLYGQEAKTNQISVLSEGLSLKTFEIDILGIKYPAGPAQYFNLMKRISSQLASCLK
ncbi:metal ABC transporter solute-binding protein, Zn/Mn family [Candidatus Pseudothioglobus sp. Uisw_016]|uniref:metal ABC transporter solute-binding protein, Zn/Mn family n=1 Tax=Candidatus Pseudothioglobus sp. Uisw_016 TaxID=3230995 RepID=UPI003A899C27